MTKVRDRDIAQLIAYGISGHHAGFPDMHGDASLSSRVSSFDPDPVWKEEIQPPLTGLEPKLSFERTHAAFQFAFLGRMICSCLVDADFRVRRWVAVFGPMIARRLRMMRPKPHTTGHLDEMFVSIGGERMCLWRAVEGEGEVLDCLVQSRRNKRAALRFMRKLVRKYRMIPSKFVADRPPSYAAVKAELPVTSAHER